MKKRALGACLAILVALIPSAAGARCYVCRHRSTEARREFKLMTGSTHGRPGYIIDHKKALKCGGDDDPSNMQWQTISDAKAKDRWERNGCA